MNETSRPGYPVYVLIGAVFFLAWFIRYAMGGFEGLGTFADIWLLGYVYSAFPHNIPISSFFRRFYRPLSWCVMYYLYSQMWDWWWLHVAFRTLIHAGNALMLYAITQRLRLHPVAGITAGLLYLTYPQTGQVIAFTATVDIAVTFSLIAIWLALGWEPGRRSYIVLSGIGILIFLASCFYETGGSIGAVAGLILLVRARKADTSWIRSLCIAIAGWIPLVLYLILFVMTKEEDDGQRFVFASWLEFPYRVGYALYKTFEIGLIGEVAARFYLFGAIDGAISILAHPLHIVCFGLFIIFVTCLLLRLTWQAAVERTGTGFAAVLGAMIAALALLPWLMTNEYPHFPFRLLYPTANGFAILVAAGIHLALISPKWSVRVLLSVTLTGWIAIFTLASVHDSNVYRRQYTLDSTQLVETATHFQPPSDAMLYLCQLPMYTQVQKDSYMTFVSSMWWANFPINPLWAAWHKLGKSDSAGQTIQNRIYDPIPPEKLPAPGAPSLALAWNATEFYEVNRFFLRFPDNSIGVYDRSPERTSSMENTVLLRAQGDMAAYQSFLNGTGRYVTDELMTERIVEGDYAYLHVYDFPDGLAARPAADQSLFFTVEWLDEYFTFEALGSFEPNQKMSETFGRIQLIISAGGETVFDRIIDQTRDVGISIPIQGLHHLKFEIKSAGDGCQADHFLLKYPVLLK